jgi:glycosyltransferase involved in cell wall biosynthesis
MGTATHNDDLEMIMPALEEVAETHPGSFELTLIGVTDGMADKPWLKRIRQPKFGAMYPNFVQWFLKQGPFDAGLSPLKDIEFNRSKSDIKCLDYLAAGLIPLVSDVTPYQSEDLDHYITKVPNEHDAWAQQLTEWVTDPREFRRQKKETARRAQRYIWRNRSSQQTAEKLRENISSLLGNE